LAPDPILILAATGLLSEAKVVQRDGMNVIACGGHGEVLRTRLMARIAAERPSGLLSIGLAGGLAPDLAVGQLVVGNAVGDHPADLNWATRLLAANPGAVSGPVAGVATPAASTAEKAALHAATGAIAVDMESHIVAEVGAAHGLPFAILRVIGDSAADTLPAAARVPLRPDGGIAMPPVLAAVARRPWEIPALIRLAGATGGALKRLQEAHIPHLSSRA
jgi:hopanoid-associated phosphorylase